MIAKRSGQAGFAGSADGGFALKWKLFAWLGINKVVTLDVA